MYTILHMSVCISACEKSLRIYLFIRYLLLGFNGMLLTYVYAVNTDVFVCGWMKCVNMEQYWGILCHFLLFCHFQLFLLLYSLFFCLLFASAIKNREICSMFLCDSLFMNFLFFPLSYTQCASNMYLSKSYNESYKHKFQQALNKMSKVVCCSLGFFLCAFYFLFLTHRFYLVDCLLWWREQMTGWAA